MKPKNNNTTIKQSKYFVIFTNINVNLTTYNDVRLYSVLLKSYTYNKISSRHLKKLTTFRLCNDTKILYLFKILNK